MGSNGFRLFSFPWVETNGPSPIEGSFVLPRNDPERARFRPDWSGTEWNLVWPGFDVRFSQPGLETGPVRPHSAPFRLGLIPHLTSSGSIPGRATERGRGRASRASTKSRLEARDDSARGDDARRRRRRHAKATARRRTGGDLLLRRLLTGKPPPLFSFPSMRFLELNSNKFGAAPAGSSCSRGRAACTGAPDVLLRIRLDPSLREAPLGKRFLHDRINQRTRLSPLDTTARTSPDAARTHTSIGLNKKT